MECANFFRTSFKTTHDFTIFLKQLPKYKIFLAKDIDELSIEDEPLQNEWCVLLDKGYVGATNYLRAKIPQRRNGQQRAELDDNMARERIICENFFGRLKNIFKICKTNFRGSNEFYKKVIPFARH